jgi:hypothetical protein
MTQQNSQQVNRQVPILGNFKLSWKLIVPIASVIIYASSYLFQVGYNLTYGIPNSLVSLDLTKIIFSLIPIMVVIAVNIVGIELIYNIVGYDPQKNLDQRKAVYNLLFFDFLLIGAIHYSFYNLRTRIFHWLILLILFLLISVILKFGPEKILFWGSHIQRPKKTNKNTLTIYRSILGSLFPNPKQIVLGILFTILSAMMIILMGSIYSSFQSSYLVESNNHNKIVLNTFGDKFIVGTVATGSTNLLTDQYQVIEPNVNISFTKQYIFQLSTVNSSKQTSGSKFINEIYDKLKNYFTKQ